ETAVDVATLDVMADYGLRFTILSPHQALRRRAPGAQAWEDCGGGIDTRRPYEMLLPSGRKIAIFFYDGAASNAIAFGALAQGGESLARLLMERFSGETGRQLVSVATDGETYGH